MAQVGPRKTAVSSILPQVGALPEGMPGSGTPYPHLLLCLLSSLLFTPLHRLISHKVTLSVAQASFISSRLKDGSTSSASPASTNTFRECSFFLLIPFSKWPPIQNMEKRQTLKKFLIKFLCIKSCDTTHFIYMKMFFCGKNFSRATRNFRTHSRLGAAGTPGHCASRNCFSLFPWSLSCLVSDPIFRYPKNISSSLPSKSIIVSNFSHLYPLRRFCA